MAEPKRAGRAGQPVCPSVCAFGGQPEPPGSARAAFIVPVVRAASPPPHLPAARAPVGEGRQQLASVEPEGCRRTHRRTHRSARLALAWAD